MNLDQLDKTKDITNTRTSAFRDKSRKTSNNLRTDDVEGINRLFIIFHRS